MTIVQGLLTFVLITLLMACAGFRPTSVPIGQKLYPASEDVDVSGRQLLVLLPGMEGRPGDYRDYGFIDMVHRHFPQTDVLEVDAHFAYYRKRILLQRLQEDVIQPAYDKGYCAVHIAGISLGGFGALLYYQHQQKTDAPAVHSITLLAPFLGDPEFYAWLLDEEKQQPESVEDTNLWPWLVSMSEQQLSGIHLAYGEQDRFAESNGVLAGLLPNEQVLVMEGRHRWPSWQKLWQAGLEQRRLVPLDDRDC